MVDFGIVHQFDKGVLIRRGLTADVEVAQHIFTRIGPHIYFFAIRQIVSIEITGFGNQGGQVKAGGGVNHVPDFYAVRQIGFGTDGPLVISFIEFDGAVASGNLQTVDLLVERISIFITPNLIVFRAFYLYI